MKMGSATMMMALFPLGLGSRTTLRGCRLHREEVTFVFGATLRGDYMEGGERSRERGRWFEEREREMEMVFNYGERKRGFRGN